MIRHFFQISFQFFVIATLTVLLSSSAWRNQARAPVLGKIRGRITPARL
jgi:hypothetical protein